MLRVTHWMVLIAAAALVACGGSGSSPSSSSLTSSSGTGSSGTSSSSGSSGAGGNVVAVVVGPGPTAASSAFNIPTTTVTVCQPGTGTCATVSNVLVDTGSSGLRLLGSALKGLTLSDQQDPVVSGNLIAECLTFVDGYVWGPVVVADVSIGGEKASGIAVHIIDDSGKDALAPAAPASCTGSAGTNLSSLDTLSANGVLGIGTLIDDCGLYCTQPVSAQNSGYVYYSCSGSSCSPTTETEVDQVANPVAHFLVDNNGVIVQLPAIPHLGTTTVSGNLVFGIGTQSNNALGSATVLTSDDIGEITANYNGQTLTGSFVDSGSNGLYFPNAALSTCTGSSGASNFYCPVSSPFAVPVTLMGNNGAMAQAALEIDNLKDLNQTYFAVNVGGPAVNNGSPAFDFGLPFFYGRHVFVAFDGRIAAGTLGPYYAY